MQGFLADADDRDDDGAGSEPGTTWAHDGSERGGDREGAVGSTHAWNLGAAEGLRSRYFKYISRKLSLFTLSLPYCSAQAAYGRSERWNLPARSWWCEERNGR